MKKILLWTILVSFLAAGISSCTTMKKRLQWNQENKVEERNLDLIGTIGWVPGLMSNPAEVISDLK